MTNNIIKIANIFNLICQQHSDIEGYHYGYESDIIRNIDNNFNVGNSVGNQFPYVLLEKLQTSSNFTNARYATIATCRLNFFALQNYNNDSTANTDNTIEQEQALRTIASDVYNAFYQYSKTQQIGVLGNSFRIESQEMQHTDRYIQIVMIFDISFNEECSNFTFDPNLVNPAYAVNPISDSVDYEKLIPV